MLIRRGFTVVEVVVVMVVMAILLTLAGLSISSTRSNARDTERNTDIEILARGLESRYTQGGLNNAVTARPSNVTQSSYPSTNEMQHIIGQSATGFTPAQIVGGYGEIALPGTTAQAFSPPGVSGSYAGFVLASGACAIENKVCILAAINPSQYYYEPIDKDGVLCNGTSEPCVRFNLYWERETDSSPVLYDIRSKHQ